jgi:hypothetical protein
MIFKFGIIFLLLIIQPISAFCKEGEIKTENKQTINSLNFYNYHFNNGYKTEKEIVFAKKIADIVKRDILIKWIKTF